SRRVSSLWSSSRSSPSSLFWSFDRNRKRRSTERNGCRLMTDRKTTSGENHDPSRRRRNKEIRRGIPSRRRDRRTEPTRAVLVANDVLRVHRLGGRVRRVLSFRGWSDVAAGAFPGSGAPRGHARFEAGFARRRSEGTSRDSFGPATSRERESGFRKELRVLPRRRWRRGDRSESYGFELDPWRRKRRSHPEDGEGGRCRQGNAAMGIAAQERGTSRSGGLRSKSPRNVARE